MNNHHFRPYKLRDWEVLVWLKRRLEQAEQYNEDMVSGMLHYVKDRDGHKEKTRLYRRR